MNLVLGGGLAGLLLASKIKNSILIEVQNRIGGIFAYEEIGGNQIPLYPPLVDEKCENFPDFKYNEIVLNVDLQKERYLSEKLGVSDIPSWLLFTKNRIYYISNMYQILDELYKKTKVRLATTFTYRGDKRFILSNGQVLKPDEVYVTVPPYLFGLKGGKSTGFAEAILLVNKARRSSTVIIDGDKGVSFSHVIIADWISESFDVIYVLAPFTSQVPSWDRVFGDLKRKGIVRKEDIISFRYRIIKDALLERAEEIELGGDFHFCGRLGKWKNFNICETIDDVLHC